MQKIPAIDLFQNPLNQKTVKTFSTNNELFYLPISDYCSIPDKPASYDIKMIQFKIEALCKHPVRRYFEVGRNMAIIFKSFTGSMTYHKSRSM